MSRDTGNRTLARQDILPLLHPTETSRFIIALVACVPAVIVALLAVVGTFGVVVLTIALIVFSVWLVLQILKAQLIANSIRVSEENFPDINGMLVEAKETLGYPKPVEVFVVNAGEMNATLFKLFATKFIVLNSELVEDMREPETRSQIMWIISRFIGALVAKHARLDVLRILVNSVESIKLFNLFLLPYERATQYSGDQIGLAACGDLDNAVATLNKMLAGNKLSQEVQVSGLVRQMAEMQSSFFGWISQLLSATPHTLNRYLNLLAFARAILPDLYEDFMRRLPASEIKAIEALLPHYHLPSQAVALGPTTAD